MKDYYLGVSRDSGLLSLPPKDLPSVLFWGDPSLSHKEMGRTTLWHASFPSATPLPVLLNSTVVFEVPIPSLSFNGGKFTLKKEFRPEDSLPQKESFYKAYMELALLTTLSTCKPSSESISKLLAGEWKKEWNLHSSEAEGCLRRSMELLGLEVEDRASDCKGCPCFFFKFSEADHQSGLLIKTSRSPKRIPLASAFYDESETPSMVKHNYPCYKGKSRWRKSMARVSEKPFTEEEWRKASDSSAEFLRALRESLEGKEHHGKWVISSHKEGKWTFQWHRLAVSRSYLIKVKGEWWAHLEWEDVEVSVNDENLRTFKREWLRTLSQTENSPEKLYRELNEAVDFDGLVGS